MVGECGRVSIEVWITVVGAGTLFHAPAGIKDCKQGGQWRSRSPGLVHHPLQGVCEPGAEFPCHTQLTIFSLREQGTMDLQGIANFMALNFVTQSIKISLFLKEGGGCKKEGKDFENVGKMKREPLSKVMFMSSCLLCSNILFALFSPDVAVLLPYDVLIHNKQLPKYLLAAKAEQQTLSVYLCI